MRLRNSPSGAAFFRAVDRDSGSNTVTQRPPPARLDSCNNIVTPAGGRAVR
jgi:hypothetical protein